MSSEPVFAPLAYPVLRDDKLQRAEDRARVRGHAAGHAAGLRAAELEAAALRARLEADYARLIEARMAELAAAGSALARAAAQLNARTAPVLAEADEALAAASLALTEALLGAASEDAYRFAKAALDRALRGADPDPVQRVRMNSDDLELLSETLAAAEGIEFIADPKLAPGDAVAELAEGVLDARLSSAVERARAALLGGRS
jgi:flagellar assembly protein FliH